jgi:hypothetical protein
MPDRYYWWWRASRVITEYDLAKHWMEIIDEFPFFSTLGDLRPMSCNAIRFTGYCHAQPLLGGFSGDTNPGLCISPFTEQDYLSFASWGLHSLIPVILEIWVIASDIYCESALLAGA